MEKKYRIRIYGTELDLEQTAKGLKVGAYEFTPEVHFQGKFYKVYVEGMELRIEFKDNAIFVNGKETDFDFQSAPQLQAKKNLQYKKGAELKAAIPGKIIEIKVKEGNHIQDQQCLVVLESMKMRNEILSPIEGIVEKIAVQEGDQVVAKQLLIKVKNI